MPGELKVLRNGFSQPDKRLQIFRRCALKVSIYLPEIGIVPAQN
jgi:hypothetical protein